jgi:threonine dehydrogenase-like Zn-dependent dehydrogenase
VPTGSLSLDDAAMIEFQAIGAHGIRRGAVTSGERVLVVGAGPIGMAAVIAAKARGADVTVTDTRADRLGFAVERLGADATVPAGEGAERRLDELTGGDFFDVVVDATGKAAAMRRGFGLVGHGGRYVLLSIVRDDITFPDPEFHKRETTLLASRNALPEDFAEVVRLMTAGQVLTRALNTHRGPLADAPSLLPAWLRPEAGVVKAILEL